MGCADIINSIGLALDILGVILLFKFGLPSEFYTPPKLLLEGGLSKEEEEKNKKIKFWAHMGLTSLILGFVFQLIGNFV